MLLLVKFDIILEKRGYERDVFGACSIDCDKIILLLSTKVIALYTLVPIVKVRVSGFEGVIMGCKVYL